jgi:hypothetical protein
LNIEKKQGSDPLAEARYHISTALALLELLSKIAKETKDPEVLTPLLRGRNNLARGLADNFIVRVDAEMAKAH